MTDSDKSSTELAEDRTEFAEERTEWAEDRTVQATERTFAGWLRTSFAAIGIGLAFRAIFGELQPPWLGQLIATSFMLMGALIAFTAQKRACASMERLSVHAIHAPKTLYMKVLSYMVSTAALVLAIAIWWLKEPSA